MQEREVLKTSFLILGLQFYVYSHCLLLSADRCVTSIEGVSLLKHSYEQSVVHDMLECYNKCKADTLCQSLNFHRYQHVCELNNRTMSLNFQRDLVPYSNSFYLDNPHRAFLGSSPLQPAVSCQEIKDASWGQAPNGRYWLFSGGHENKPAVAYCDMEKGVEITCTGSPCKNGATCEYQGEGEYSCQCQKGFTGSHCETDFNECSSNPCLNGGTCIDVINGFNCTCPAYLTGDRCELGLGQECNSYILNEEIDRSVTHATTGSSHKCDKTLATGWYRFNSTSGFKMPTTCIAPNKCNTHATGWLNGTHPSPQEGIVSRTVCFNWSGKCCNWQLVISVRNCGLFYVYNLTKTDNCNLRYCVTN